MKKQTVIKSLIAIKNAFFEMKNSYVKGRDCSSLFNAFKNRLDCQLKSYDIEYDFLVGSDTVNIGGETKNYVPKKYDTLLFDVSVKVDGVWCDITRTFFIEDYTPSQKEAFEIIKKSLRSGQAFLKDGAIALDIYNAVNLEHKNLSNQLVHHAGHLIDCEPVMEPRFLKDNDKAIKLNDIVAIESGVYKEFGLRLENDYFITQNGCEDLFEELMPLEIDNYVLKEI